MSDERSVRIVGFAGSAREDSFNKRLLRAGLRECEAAGASCTFVDLRDHPLPLYDGDLERADGLPESASKLRRILSDHDGFLVATPEYNGSITPLLKNTLDWISRSEKAHPDLSPYQGKYAMLFAASPGPLGGLRGLRVVRELFNNLGVTVLANQLNLRGAHEHFSEVGELETESQRDRVELLTREFVETLRALKSVG